MQDACFFMLSTVSVWGILRSYSYTHSHASPTAIRAWCFFFSRFGSSTGYFSFSKTRGNVMFKRVTTIARWPGLNACSAMSLTNLAVLSKSFSYSVPIPFTFYWLQTILRKLNVLNDSLRKSSRVVLWDSWVSALGGSLWGLLFRYTQWWLGLSLLKVQRGPSCTSEMARSCGW